MSNSTWSGVFHSTDLDAAVRKPRTSLPPLNIGDEVMGRNKAERVSLYVCVRIYIYIHIYSLPFYFRFLSGVLDDLMKTKDTRENEGRDSCYFFFGFFNIISTILGN